jgi:hypothetical protein
VTPAAPARSRDGYAYAGKGDSATKQRDLTRALGSSRKLLSAIRELSTYRSLFACLVSWETLPGMISREVASQRKGWISRRSLAYSELLVDPMLDSVLFDLSQIFDASKLDDAGGARQ